jgi:hypothetical protein
MFKALILSRSTQLPSSNIRIWELVAWILLVIQWTMMEFWHWYKLQHCYMDSWICSKLAKMQVRCTLQCRFYNIALTCLLHELGELHSPWQLNKCWEWRFEFVNFCFLNKCMYLCAFAFRFWNETCLSLNFCFWN